MGAAIKTKVGTLSGSNVTDVLDDTKTLAQSNAAGTTPFSYFLSARTWAGSTPYEVGDLVVSNGNIYRATQAGTSNATGGPTGNGTGIIDSGAKWDYVQPGTVAGATEARVNILGNDNDRVAYGIHANRNAAIVSTGETTGSWARDLLRGLASIAGLTPDKAQLGNDYTTFITTVRKGLESAVDALALERGSLGLTEARLEGMASLQESISTSLTLQLSNLEEVDMAKTITSFQTTQSQLEASYRALAISQQLSLTRFL
jgi:flagellin-like hook-associated protein FlgL